MYSYREFDEAEWFTHFSKEYGIELGTSPDAPTLENASLAKGYEYISIITTKVDAMLVQRFHDLGVRMISTRTVGYDHIDLDKARELGMQVATPPILQLRGRLTLMLMLMSYGK